MNMNEQNELGFVRSQSEAFILTCDLACDLEQPSIRLGSQRVEIKSPKFPNSFPTQTQCKWM